MSLDVKTQLISEPIKPQIGSRILNGKAELLSGALSDQIRDLLEQRGVLVFPQVNLSDEEQVAFTKTLGTFAHEIHGEEIYKVTLDTKENSRADYLKGAFFWHIDGTMSKMPIMASLLSAKALAPIGGDTEFANTYAAYEALPDARKKELEGLRVVHSFWNSQLYHEPEPSLTKLEEWMALGTNELPLVWTHRSGRKSLVIGNTAQYVVGMDPISSAKLLHGLRDWATGESFRCTHKWSLGDLVMWDNTGTMHRATPYALDSGRMMHRTKLQGEEPFA
jgi:alpha-ketoglutarate-dependent taurine dioxygenase